MKAKATTIIGILIIIGGFLAPFLSNGGIPAILFFWVGFLVLFSEGYNDPHAIWKKWAKYGVIANAIGTFIIIQLLALVVESKHSFISGKFPVCLNSIICPVSSISARIWPMPTSNTASGIAVIMSYYRTTVTSFFDIAACIVFGLIIKKGLMVRNEKNT